MGNSSAAPERERYQGMVAAVAEVAQELLTLQDPATPYNPDRQSLVVKQIAVRLDDIRRTRNSFNGSASSTAASPSPSARQRKPSRHS
jgi:hypothetical protein